MDYHKNNPSTLLLPILEGCLLSWLEPGWEQGGCSRCRVANSQGRTTCHTPRPLPGQPCRDRLPPRGIPNSSTPAAHLPRWHPVEQWPEGGDTSSWGQRDPRQGRGRQRHWLSRQAGTEGRPSLLHSHVPPRPPGWDISASSEVTFNFTAANHPECLCCGTCTQRSLHRRGEMPRNSKSITTI